METLACVLFGAIIAMCILAAISEVIWPDQKPLSWEEDEMEERKRQDFARKFDW